MSERCCCDGWPLAARFCWEAVEPAAMIEAVRVGTSAGLIYVALVLVVLAGAMWVLLSQDQ